MRWELEEPGRASTGGVGGCTQSWLKVQKPVGSVEGPEQGHPHPCATMIPGAWDAVVVSSWDAGVPGEGCHLGVWPPV